MLNEAGLKLLVEWPRWNFINWTMLHPSDEKDLEWLFLHLLETGSTYEESEITKLLMVTFISHHAEKPIRDDIVNIAMYVRNWHKSKEKK